MFRKALILAISLVLILSACVVPTPVSTTLPPAAALAPSATPVSIPPAQAPEPSPSTEIVPEATPTDQAPALKRVVLISMDGLGARFVTPEIMPFLAGLAEAGASAKQASTNMPSVTLPSHVSMLTGLCTETHGVTWNDNRPGYPEAEDLFEVAHNAGLYTMMLVAKLKLKQITEPANVDRQEIRYHGDPSVMEAAMEMIREDFNLFFIHLPGGDDYGHTQGWDSSAQLENFTATDALLKTFVEALAAKDGLKETLLIFTADHGGTSYNHGNNVPEDMLIPWIAYGWQAKKVQIEKPVSTADTTPTIAWALGLPLPASWEGSPIYEAFGSSKTRQVTECTWPN